LITVRQKGDFRLGEATIAAELPADADVARYLADRTDELDRRLKRFARLLRAGRRDGVSLVRGTLKVTPLSAITPPEADAIDRRLDGATTGGDHRAAAGGQRAHGFASVLATNTPLSIGDLLHVLAVSLVTSKGAHGVPGSAIVILAATLNAVPSIPAIGLVLVLSVD
jgi:hypothetical protein